MLSADEYLWYRQYFLLGDRRDRREELIALVQDYALWWKVITEVLEVSLRRPPETPGSAGRPLSEGHGRIPSASFAQAPEAN